MSNLCFYLRPAKFWVHYFGYLAMAAVVVIYWLPCVPIVKAGLLLWLWYITHRYAEAYIYHTSKYAIRKLMLKPNKYLLEFNSHKKIAFKQAIFSFKSPWLIVLTFKKPGLAVDLIITRASLSPFEFKLLLQQANYFVS